VLAALGADVQVGFEVLAPQRFLAAVAFDPEALGQDLAAFRALQLRFLQTLTEIATEKNSTIIFPIPIDLIRPFVEKAGNKPK
jgi:hypothetical protein